ncbi:UDP-N-acetylmuramate--alanine ligase [Desulfitispora alkaliphila]|uniref:UDP-N-acetylmuramate--L-alanine ligase n=1 Tax=Desulfitispora alkaliphila TaxID=622674 RepID=UPI003D2589F7
MLQNIKKIHFIGIGGIGMSGLADILLSQGYEVTGSDLSQTEVTRRLKDKGAEVYLGHAEENISFDIDLAVISTAIPEENVELLKCNELGINLLHRGELLARLMEQKEGIAIAGAHGKTTTTAMLGLVLEECKQDPAIVIGGDVKYLEGNAKWGEGKHFIAEADESDGSFLKLTPTMGVVTNIEDDHLDYYGSKSKIISAFENFVSDIESRNGLVVLCANDSQTMKIADKAKKCITYGIDVGDLYATSLRYHGTETSADVFYHNRFLGKLTLNVPGKHNVSNALAVIVISLEMGLQFSDICEALKKFSGVKRRFEVIGKAEGVSIIDDYAHHPTEIIATLEALKNITNGKVICVFQPHRYSRTAQLYREFAASFAKADLVLIDDIYAAGEKPITNISSKDIVELIGETEAYHCRGKEEIINRIVKVVQPGDAVITMGAGDIWKTAVALAKRLRKVS